MDSIKQPSALDREVARFVERWGNPDLEADLRRLLACASDLISPPDLSRFLPAFPGIQPWRETVMTEPLTIALLRVAATDGEAASVFAHELIRSREEAFRARELISLPTRVIP